MRYIFLILVALLTAFPAYALTIRNLSGSTQVIIVEQGGAAEEVIIQPGETAHRLGGGLALMMPGHTLRNVDSFDEYAIWPDGALTIQKRQHVKNEVR